MLRVTSNSLAAQLTSDLSRLSTSQSTLTRQMATGRRLNAANDDVPATGRVMSYESEKRALQQYERNSQRALTNIKVSTTSLESIKKMGSTIFNLAPSAASSGDADQQAAMALQVDGLIEQVLSLANTQVGGSYLFGGLETGTQPFTATRDATTGRITAVTYAGDNGAAPSVDVSENARVAMLNNGTQNLELRDMMNNLVALRDAVTNLSTATAAGNQAGMATARATLTTTQNTLGADEDRITNMLSTLTTSQFRITSSQEQNTVRFNQLADLSDGETKIDLAETIIKYQNSERSYQAALQAGAKILQRSLLDYI
jgi:flagellar hook-associated protein 3 FlgL